MSDNPYAQVGPSGTRLDEFAEPERTSLLAIGSLICSLTCCLSPIGLLMGVGALVGISGSRGRVGGKGLAVAGTLLGLLGTVVWIGVLIGGQRFAAAVTGEFMPLAGAVVTEVEAQNYDAVRATLVTPTDTLATDGAIDRFREGYRTGLGLGAYKGTPTDVGLFDVFGMYAPFAQALQGYQGRNDVMPLVGTFENGTGLVVVIFDQATAQRQGSFSGLPVRNVLVFTADGQSVSLIDPLVIEAARNGRLEELFPGTETVPADQLPGAQNATDPTSAEQDAMDAAEDAFRDAVDEVIGIDPPADEDDGGG